MVAFNNHFPFVPAWCCIGNRKFGNYWETYSIKAGRNVRLYSDLEYYFWILLESDPRFVALCEQPLRIRVRMSDGKWVGSILDFWCRDRDGEHYFFEVKYARDIAAAQVGSRVLRQLRAQLVWAQQTGVRYALATERTIWQQPMLLANWSTVLRHLVRLREHPQPDLGERQLRAVAAQGPIALRDVLGNFRSEDPHLVRRTLFWELHAGRLAADLAAARLSGRTLIHLPHA